MSPELLTVVVGTVITAVGMVFVPLYVNRRMEQNKKQEAIEEEAAKHAADDGASWQAFNASIVQERNRLLGEIERLQTEHRIEMARVHDRHHEEITSMRGQWEKTAREMREKHEAEIAALTRDLTSCRKEVAELHGEIYKLQHPPTP